MAPSFTLEGLGFSDQVLFHQFGSGPVTTSSSELVHKAFESVVDQQPNVIAVEHDGKSLTYAELDRAANGLANQLIVMGLEPRQPVCLVVQRSLPMVIAMLAVLKCGCQYVPLDGQVTIESALSHIMKDTGASFVLCLEKFRQKIEPLVDAAIKIVDLDSTLEQHDSKRRPELGIDKSDGAYIIYTSG